MAAASASPTRRPARTPARPLAPRALAPVEAATEPPNKKRKFIHSGLEDGNFVKKQMVESANVVVAQTAPRPRPRREATSTNDGKPTPMQTRPRRERPERYAPPPTTPRPRYSNAAAAAAASQASDGYKPREERSWEDFHPDLNIDSGLLLYTADEVDGKLPKPDPKLQKLGLQDSDGNRVVSEDVEMQDAQMAESQAQRHELITPLKRRPGRPPRRAESMLSGLGSPPAPKIVPLPTHNPKERLNLPKPSFRTYNHFLQFENDQNHNKANYVDRTMAHVGYQESDRFKLPDPVLIRLYEGQQVEDEAEVSLRLEGDGLTDNIQSAPVVGRVEYDMDEQDVAWLEDINEQRKTEGVDAIKPAIFEITMTQIEKEYHALEKRIPKPQPRHAQTHRPRSSSQAAVNGDPNPPTDEPDSKCSICDDGDCENANAIIFCDGCDLAVHQECYGVPFIPEGQWFCRKCKEIGRGTPTCIFCPNVDGAFKQTNTMRWSHLLCAIWIPEVTIANMTFMEPITDVDKVPKPRWKLNCYICNQKMGACIQCSNKNCYQAFHVTCARRAKLYLKMKSQHQGGIDTSALKAFCDKHVPQEWRRTQDTDTATMDAKRWYRHAMKDRKWADSQNAAVELGAPPAPDGGPGGDNSISEDTIAVSKRRKTQPQKLSWRLPSGAPVVPAVVYSSVEAGLTRFTIRKRKEFVEKACRYWTLKREARRGAALLKRLQLQLESFSTMEITRRNYAAMGAVGRSRLLRRIEFGELLQKDMDHLQSLCTQTREREELRLQEVEQLRRLVDTVYFPIPTLLLPILQHAHKLDEKTRFFTAGFDVLEERMRERYYTSVADFSRDMSRVFSDVMAPNSNVENTSDADIDAIHTQLNEVKPGTAEHLALTHDQKELKRTAKRILKIVKESLDEAARKEADLRKNGFEEHLSKLDAFSSLFSNGERLSGAEGGEARTGHLRSNSNVSAVAGAAPSVEMDTDMPDAEERTDEAVIHLNVAGKADTVPIPSKKRKADSKAASYTSSNGGINVAAAESKPTEPLSPPISRPASAEDGNAAPHEGDADPAPVDMFAQGGVPWYLEQFDPVGTTIHDERYTGRAVLRAMSEELSDMDEDTLIELAEHNSAVETPAESVVEGDATSTATAVSQQAKKKKKPRRSHWGRRR